MFAEDHDDFAFRFEYADKSAFVVYADGRAFIELPSGKREQKFGKIDNRIPLLIGMVAKPRQDEIDRLRTELSVERARADSHLEAWRNETLVGVKERT